MSFLEGERSIRRRIGGPIKRFGKGMLVGSTVMQRPEGMATGAAIYGTGRMIEGRKKRRKHATRTKK